MNLSYTYLIFPLLALLLAYFPLAAQDTTFVGNQKEAVFSVEGDSVIVTAARGAASLYTLPFAADLIRREEIRSAEQDLSLEKAMRETPGIVVNNRFNLSQGDRISIRGMGSRASFGVRGIKLILDGIPLTMPDGQAQLNNLDLGSAGSIEILRGPSSSLYGNASGGVINIQTESAASSPFVFFPEIILGDDGLQKLQGKVSGTVGRHQYLLNISQTRSDGFREHSEGKITNLNAVGRHSISDQFSLNSVINYVDAPFLMNPSSLDKSTAENEPRSTRFFVRQQGAGKQVRQVQGGLTLSYNNRKHTTFNATIYALGRSLFNPIPGRIIDLDRSSGGFRFNMTHVIKRRSRTLRMDFGVDLEMQRDTRREFENNGIESSQIGQLSGEEILNNVRFGDQLLDQKENVDGIGPFAQMTLSFDQKWFFSGGIRYDRYRFEVDDQFVKDGVNNSGSLSMNQASPMAGIVYRPEELTKIYGNVSTAFQTPTTSELSNRPDGPGGFNENLMPERMISYEAGIKSGFFQHRLQYDAAIYLLNVNDMLIPFQSNDPESEEIFFRNAGKTQNKGVELRLEFQALPGIRATAAYTYMDFTFKDYAVAVETDEGIELQQLAGNMIPGIPKHQLFAGISYQRRSGVFGSVNAQWTDRYWGNDFNGPGPGSSKPSSDFINDQYLLADMRVGLSGRILKVGLSILAGVNNLFDKRHNRSIVPNAFGDRFFEPAAGRQWFAGIRLGLPQN